MNILTIFRSSLFILSFLGMIAGAQWLRMQHRQLNNLRQQNTRLNMQTEQLTERLLQVKVQAATLAAAISAQQRAQQQLEENNHAVREKLGHALAKNRCASEFVPADVISLQREAISRTARP
ncbi:hypothetical protein [Serratia sp. 2723]|uniref:hypothetical protein n=1 Tax=unclassified Serratia (in: enterobacteria) TaxID=2647522 RepID=UPI003D19582A